MIFFRIVFVSLIFSSLQSFHNRNIGVFSAWEQKIQNRDSQSGFTIRPIQQRHISTEQIKHRQKVTSVFLLKQKGLLEMHSCYQAMKEAVYAYHNDKNIWQNRDKALRKTISSGGKQYHKKYRLKSLTAGYLLSQNISPESYEYFTGNAIQQQYHGEMCDMLEHIAKMKLKGHESYLLSHATDFIKASHETNQKNYVVPTGIGCLIAQKFVEVAQLSYRYINAVVGGVVESGKDFVHMVLHPQQTVKDMSKLIYYFVETVALAEAWAEIPNDQRTTEQWNRRMDKIGIALCTLKNDFTALDGPGRVKALTRFGADFIIPDKIIAACGHVVAGVNSHGKRLLADVIKCATEKNIPLVNVAGELGAAVDIELSKQLLQEFMQVDKELAPVQNLARSLQAVVKDVQALGGVIPYHRTDLLNEFNDLLIALKNELKFPVREKLKKLYPSLISIIIKIIFMSIMIL